MAGMRVMSRPGHKHMNNRFFRAPGRASTMLAMNAKMKPADIASLVATAGFVTLFVLSVLSQVTS